MCISSTRKQESSPYEFHYILYIFISSPRKHILSHPSKKITNFWNMTTTRNVTINTRWGHADQTTSTLHRYLKWLKPTEKYLFHLLPQYILTDINIWVSGLEHRKKFKAVITNINPLCNLILFAIPQELWAPYHNLSVYSGWYNECSYTWAHRRVPTNTCLRYQQIFNSYSTVIKTLTQWHTDLYKAVVACQHITWDKIHSSHISDRRLWITTLSIMLHAIHVSSQGGDHAEHAVP